MKITKYLLLLLAAFALAACHNDTKDSKKPAGGTRRTVVMYVSAENSLGYNGFHKKDSTEIMAGSQFLNARDQLVLYLDDRKNPRIYRIYKGCKAPQLLKRFDTNLCSSNPAVLRDVLSWVKTTYPSESYGLVMWSHADGWLPSWNTDYKDARSFGVDVGTGGDMRRDLDKDGRLGTAMDIDSIAWAVEKSEIHPKYIFFDACFMQCIEADYALRHVTDYIVASPISTPAIGANYTTLLRKGLFTDNPADIAEAYFSYMTSLPSSNVYHDFGMVVSCVKTSELDALALKTKQYISTIPAYYTDELGNTAHRDFDMSGVTHYTEYIRNLFYRPHFYDLAAAMKHILPAAAYADWKTQLDRCIAYKNATPRFYVYYDSATDRELYLYTDATACSAISAFIPQELYTKNAAMCEFGDLNEAFRNTEWYHAAGWADAQW